MGAIVAGWGIAQGPQILPGLTVDQAAADDATLVALLVSLAIGAVILIPSLVLLFGLGLRGRTERPEALGSLEKAARHPVATGPRASSPRRPVVAFVCAAIGMPLTVANDAGAGLVLLLAAMAAGAAFVVPPAALNESHDGRYP